MIVPPLMQVLKMPLLLPKMLFQVQANAQIYALIQYNVIYLLEIEPWYFPSASHTSVNNLVLDQYSVSADTQGSSIKINIRKRWILLPHPYWFITHTVQIHMGSHGLYTSVMNVSLSSLLTCITEWLVLHNEVVAV